MKYIITEERFERLVSSYLNTLTLQVIPRNNVGFEISDSNGLVFVYRKEKKQLYISNELVKDVKNLFSFETIYDAWSYIKNWFQDKYNAPVTRVFLLFDDSPMTVEMD